MSELNLDGSAYWRAWRAVPVLTLAQAAWLLANFDPGEAENPSAIAPSSVRALIAALSQSISRGELEVRVHMEGTSHGFREVISKRNESDDLSVEVDREALATWADKNQLSHGWNTSCQPTQFELSRFPREMRIAIEAHEAVRHDLAALRGKSPKQALLNWLKTNYSDADLSESARERIAVIANWASEGGAPRTPSPSEPTHPDAG